jgi:hypoxanthine-guanine phosphoribosyltransferase
MPPPTAAPSEAPDELFQRGGSPPEFVEFTIGQGFVVGYGIDYAEQYRGLRDIRVLV